MTTALQHHAHGRLIDLLADLVSARVALQDASRRHEQACRDCRDEDGDIDAFADAVMVTDAIAKAAAAVVAKLERSVLLVVEDAHHEEITNERHRRCGVLSEGEAAQ